MPKTWCGLREFKADLELLPLFRPQMDHAAFLLFPRVPILQNKRLAGLDLRGQINQRPVGVDDCRQGVLFDDTAVYGLSMNNHAHPEENALAPPSIRVTLYRLSHLVHRLHKAGHTSPVPTEGEARSGISLPSPAILS
jgi:hypothetical protein